MDLNAFYDLRARLQAGMAAGASLAAEDFRLRRALEALAPLEGASPVFRKLGQLTRALLAPDCPDKAGALLDALSLADAVACTQASVAVPGEVEPLKPRRRGRAVTNAPYSLLAPLLEGLTTSGGGRYSYVVGMHDQMPELFEDYRVTEALVRALGASYAELAQRAEEWLSGENESILPLLQEGFDPRGKKEMVRRVRVMEAVGGAQANDYFLRQLPKAEKDVRAALIYALRRNPDNAGRLVELCKTEKSKCKDAAHWALEGMDVPEAWEYWGALAKKKPAQAAQYMLFSTSQMSSTLVAEWLDRWLAGVEGNPPESLEWSKGQELQQLLFTLPGKSGPEVENIYRRMARLGDALDFTNLEHAPGDKPTALRLKSNAVGRTGSYAFSEIVPEIVRHSLLLHPTPGLAELAQELERDYPGRFTSAAVAAALLFQPAGEVWELVKPLLEHPGRKRDRQILCETIGIVRWDVGRGCPVMPYVRQQPFGGDAPRSRVIRWPVREPLDMRIYETLLERLEKFDDVLIPIIPTVQDQALRERIGEKLYRSSLLPGLDPARRARYLQGMNWSGWQKCENLAVQYCRSRKIDYYNVLSFLQGLPGDVEARLAEARRVYELAAKGEFGFDGAAKRHPEYFLSQLQNYIDNLHR